MYRIIRLIILGIRIFKLPGFLFLLFLAEIHFLDDYAASQVYFVKYAEEPILVEGVLAEKTVNSDGEVGFCFCVTVSNYGASESPTKIGCKGETGGYLHYDFASEYKNIKISDPWRDKVLGHNVVPPGTKMTLQLFISQEEINEFKGEQLIFMDGFSKSYVTISVDELKNKGKDSK